MALSGVEVKVIDESFYIRNPHLPTIFVATAPDKQNGAGTGTAPNNSGKCR